MGFRLVLGVSLRYRIDFNCFYDQVAGVQNPFCFLTLYYWRVHLALLDWRNRVRMGG